MVHQSIYLNDNELTVGCSAQSALTMFDFLKTRRTYGHCLFDNILSGALKLEQISIAVQPFLPEVDQTKRLQIHTIK